PPELPHLPLQLPLELPQLLDFLAHRLQLLLGHLQRALHGFAAARGIRRRLGGVQVSGPRLVGVEQTLDLAQREAEHQLEALDAFDSLEVHGSVQPLPPGQPLARHQETDLVVVMQGPLREPGPLTYLSDLIEGCHPGTPIPRPAGRRADAFSLEEPYVSVNLLPY